MKKFLKSLLGGTVATATAVSNVSAQDDFPPKPTWVPEFKQSLEEVSERCHFYFNKSVDIAVFENGTCVIVEGVSTDEMALSAAKEILENIVNYHPDMNPLEMKDGNTLVRYNHPAFNVVLKSTFDTHKKSFEDNHLKGLTRDEVLMTPLGPNKFDEFGMKALYGRSLMFLDAMNPKMMKFLKAEKQK